jgi:S1-C subfamily serine protease
MKTLPGAIKIICVVLILSSAGGCISFESILDPDLPAAIDKDHSFAPYDSAKVDKIPLDSYLKLRNAQVENYSHNVSFGSATIITSDGYALTARHCWDHGIGQVINIAVQGPPRLVWESQTKEQASDFVVFKLQPIAPAPAYSWCDDSALHLHENVVTMSMNGHAAGELLALSVRECVSNPAPGDPPILWIVHSAPLYGGDSGGAIATVDGKLIGINIAATQRGHQYVSIALRPDLKWLAQIIQDDRRAHDLSTRATTTK